MIRYKVLREASIELKQAVAYLAERNPSAAIGLVSDYEKALRMVRSYPEAFLVEPHGIRKHALSRYPYSLVYQVEGGILLVLAFMHQKRRPNYWAKRAK